MGNHSLKVYNTNFYVYSEEVIVHVLVSLLEEILWRYVFPSPKRRTALLENRREFDLDNWHGERQQIAKYIKSLFENIKVFIVDSEIACDRIISQIIYGDNPVHFIGLDCEWTKITGTVDLIQISTGSSCILYRTMVDQHLPDSLKNLLEDPNILKVGVGIQHDVSRLRHHGISTKDYIDLWNLVKICFEEVSEWKSLQSLSENVIEVNLPKDSSTRCSDWSVPTLSIPQILYGAKDAIVATEIFYTIALLKKLYQDPSRDAVSLLNSAFISKNGEIDTSVKFPIDKISDSSSEKKLNQSLTGFHVSNTEKSHIPYETLSEPKSNLHTTSCKKLDSEIIHYIHTFSEGNLGICYYSHKYDNLLSAAQEVEDFFTNENAISTSPWFTEYARFICADIVNRKTDFVYDKTKSPRKPKNTSKKGFDIKLDKHCCRNRPLYENCFLVGPDRQVLATVNRSKAMWYVNREIGEIESESPFTVRLLFEPSGRPMPEADYYTTVKSNVCVVCEATDNLVRKMVIPHDYRKYFPVEFKDHMSHDVLLLCLRCHRKAQIYDEELRQILASNYDAPFGTKEQVLYVDNPDFSKVRSAAKALTHGKNKIPAGRRKELESIVRKHFNALTCTEELIQKALSMNIKQLNKDFKGLHGERVMKSVMEEGTLVEFVIKWRQRFLDCMQPKYLPPMWSVDHNLHKISKDLLTDRSPFLRDEPPP